MTTLTADQSAALSTLDTHLTAPDGVAALLEGGAGTGKTFLLAQILHHQAGNGPNRRIIAVAAPTHKATNVLRKKLDVAGVEWVRGYDAYSYDQWSKPVITGTTAALLGIGPVIADDQNTKEVKFGRTSEGILGKVTPAVLIVDEVSMLGSRDFMALVETGKKRGMKIIAIGDAGQLPPVKQQAIPFDRFKRTSTLREIVRQARGSAIIDVAWAVRDGREWQNIRGSGVRVESDMLSAFIEAVQVPGERPEEQREVFIAYRNRTVDTAQEKACRKLYGHSARAFMPGELVLAETNLYREKVLLCTNQDEIVVEQFHEEEKDPTIGTPVRLRHRGRGGSFTAHYLSPEELADAGHPYNVELRRLEEEAKRLQAAFKKLTGATPLQRSEMDRMRKQAWRAFFQWRDQTVISFRHPFAITSHKSQGSTYRQVFADVVELANFSRHALYVAVTRPAAELVMAA